MVEQKPVVKVNEFGYGEVVKEVETGLSKGQTAGTVGGEYVVRPAGSDVMQTYIPGTGSTSIMIEGGATAGRGGRGIGGTTIVRRDPYGNIIGVKQVGPTGETIFERKATPGGGYVEENLPFSIQPRFAEIERTRAEMPLYRQMAIQPAIVATPAPPQLDITQAYPSTPIDYTRTHVSELYSYPLYKGASFVSRGLQSYYERFIDIFPTPEPVKEVQKGVGSVFIGIPEFLASGIAGWEYAAREPEVFKKEVVPAVKVFGAGLAEQATERPYYTAGQAAVIGYGMRGLVKAPSISSIKTKISFEPASGIQSLRETLPTIKIEPSSRIGDIRAAGEVISGYKTGFISEFQKPSYQVEKAMMGRGTVEYFGEGIKTELARPTRGKEAISATTELFGEYKAGIGYELARPTRGKEALVATSELFKGYKVGFEYELAKPTMRKQAIVGMKKAFGEMGIEAGRELYKPTIRSTSFYAARDIFKGYGVEFIKVYKATPYKLPIKSIGRTSDKITTWHLRPTPEYIQAKFMESNIFRGGDIGKIAETLKTSPTVPTYPRQIQPMGLTGRPVTMPKQISFEAPLKGLTVSEIKPTPAPTGAEIKTSTGLVLIQKTVQKPKVEVIQAPKVEALQSQKVSLRMKAVAIPRFQTFTQAMTRTQPGQAALARTRTELLSMQTPRAKAISRALVTPKAMAKLSPMTVQKAAVRQMPQAIPKMAQVSVSITTPMLKKPAKLKNKISYNIRIPKTGFGRKSYKFPELTRVATPRQIVKGFRL